MLSSVAQLPATARRTTSYLASAWMPVVICIMVIACESTVYFGADHTTGPLRRFFEWLMHRHFTQPEWWRLHLTIRKCGHFTGYGILSATWFRAFWMTWALAVDPIRRRIATHGFAMLGTLLIAACDETHQLFLANRSGSIQDVAIDCTGGLLVQVILWLIMRTDAQD